MMNKSRDVGDHERFPPRTKAPKPEPGQDFDALTAQYGRPRGRFEIQQRPPKREQERGAL